jgi:perosamine synthetase
VHTYGLPADAVKISKFCIENNVSLVEDAAEAHGQNIDGLKCGSFGKMTTFSFYANKHITTGEGGMVLTDDLDIFNNLKQMRNLDFTGTNRFNHDHFYWNYRLGGLQAALGISQLKNLEKTIKIKKTQGKNYLSILEQHKDIFQMPIVDFNKSENHFWVFGVVLQKQNIRDKVMSDLADEGIETRPFFWPLHLQNVLPKEFKQKNISLEVSENLGKNGLYLPMGSHINFQKQKYIVSKLVQIHNSYVS